MTLAVFLAFAAAAFGGGYLMVTGAARLQWACYAAAAFALGAVTLGAVWLVFHLWLGVDRGLLFVAWAAWTVWCAWRGRVLAATGVRLRAAFERLGLRVFQGATAVALLVTVGIALSVLFEASRFFSIVSPLEFLFGLEWSPQLSLRDDQEGSSGAFGAIPLFVGTLLISAIAMAVAVPVGLMSAVYLSEFATPRVRNRVKPALEILAGIPTVVYGFFAVVTLTPLMRGGAGALGIGLSGESALVAGLVMGAMIVPFVASLSEDAIHAVPKTLRDGSLALGATVAETVSRVILPAALAGIAGSFLLAFSRAIGETMIVVMAAGLSANLTVNPLEAVTTVTVQIVTLLTGDQEFDDPKTLAAFALGLALFCSTLALNAAALSIVRRHHERYD